MHRNFPGNRIASAVDTFGGISTQEHPVLIVSHASYQHRRELASSVSGQQTKGRHVEVVFPNIQHPADKVDNAALLNVGIQEAAERGLPFFTMVSSDLGGQLPRFRDHALQRLQTDESMLVVGAAIEGVHDLSLVDKVLRDGQGAVHVGNYAGVFPSNAMATYRLEPVTSDGRAVKDLRLKQEFEEALGSTTIDGQNVPLRGHEDIELALRMLSQGIVLEVVLLTGNGIKRDATTEVPTRRFKYETRQQVADGYQRIDGLPDGDLKDFLNNNLHIEAVNS